MNGKVLLVDEDRCDGCMLCVAACSMRHFGRVDVGRSHIQVWHTGADRHVPLTCHHCEAPSCVGACPTKACHVQLAEERVMIKAERCIGCRSCVVACPFGHAHYDAVLGVSSKCDYCDGEPECVRVCEPKAIQYVWADEDASPTRRRTAVVRGRERLRLPTD